MDNTATPFNQAADQLQMDFIIERFFQSVSFRQDETPAYEELHALFVPGGLLIKNTTGQPEISQVEQFIAPRRTLVRSGALRAFHEAELHASTQRFGHVAHRFSAYVKTGILQGTPFSAKGMISTQFVMTADGWRISAMAWDDERPGLEIGPAP